MNTPILQNLGLTPEQATVYETLLEHGASPARRVVMYTGIKRGMVYKALEQLIEKGLVTKNDAPVAIFAPEHPSKLRMLLDQQAKEIEATKASFDGMIGTLVSNFNLISGKPNVQFFEGKKGLEQVLEDSLYARSEIYTYVDIETLIKHFADFNEKYVRQRDKLGIRKKGLVLDTPFARKFLADYHQSVTETRLIPLVGAPFRTIMQMYDNKVTYVTLDEQSMIGAIIEDKNIYAMHQYLFERLWSVTPAFEQEAQ